jgi:hypothetical protein
VPAAELREMVHAVGLDASTLPAAAVLCFQRRLTAAARSMQHPAHFWTEGGDARMMSKGRLPTWVLSLAMLVALGGCGVPTKPPVRDYVRVTPSFHGPLDHAQSIGLITDAVITFDSVGSRYITLDDSRTVASSVLADARHFVESKGYQVKFAETQTVGGFLEKEVHEKSAQTRGAEVTETVFPVMSGEVYADTGYRDAFRRVLRHVMLATISKGEIPAEQFRADAQIPESLRIITNQRQVDYLAVVLAKGVIVSGGKQMGQTLATGLISTVMTAGLITATRHDISYLDSYVGVINVKTGELEWCNSLRLNGDPSKPEFYKEDHWSATVLYYLTT